MCEIFAKPAGKTAVFQKLMVQILLFIREPLPMIFDVSDKGKPVATQGRKARGPLCGPPGCRRDLQDFGLFRGDIGHARLRYEGGLFFYGRVLATAPVGHAYR